jgi:hypothetical protein
MRQARKNLTSAEIAQVAQEVRDTLSLLADCRNRGETPPFVGLLDPLQVIYERLTEVVPDPIPCPLCGREMEKRCVDFAVQVECPGCHCLFRAPGLLPHGSVAQMMRAARMAMEDV